MIILCGCVILLGLALLNERATKRSAAEGHRAMALAYAGQEAMFDKAEIVRALGMRRAMVARQIADRRAGLEASATTQFVASRYSGLVKFARMFMQSLRSEEQTYELQSLMRISYAVFCLKKKKKNT